MSFTDATATGAEYVWGAKWRTPTSAEMNELLKATTEGSTKVSYEYIQENGVWGIKYTGLETGYTTNSVFFPAYNGSSDSGIVSYWSSTGGTSTGELMDLQYMGGGWLSDWHPNLKGLEYPVRPVLVEN